MRYRRLGYLHRINLSPDKLQAAAINRDQETNNALTEPHQKTGFHYTQSSCPISPSGEYIQQLSFFDPI
jgi:hypothetical protein